MTMPVLAKVADFLTIDRAPIMMSPAHRSGTDDAGVPVDTVTRWLWSWVAPSILIAVSALLIQIGVYIGRGPYETLNLRVTAHDMIEHHAGAVGYEVLDLRFADVTRRLERIERLAESHQANGR